ncbi:universal stress protein A-like protein [Primulina huaijiensis]|uniref:universal stress protein A-like protein n=1 Tax=Primulina huaijiensis TaxID=1492673 RepID=UPI003CC7829B
MNMASESSEPTRILVAVNQSTLKGYPHASISSKGAFEWTLHKIIRSNTCGFKLLILHVQVPDEDGFDGVDSIYASPEDFKSLRQRDKNNGLQLLHYFVKQCHEIGVACEAWIKTGDAKDVICHEVKRLQPDLLVVGNRGLGPFQKVFVGTVSGFVTKHADCPVISIKRSADQTPQDPAED